MGQRHVVDTTELYYQSVVLLSICIFGILNVVMFVVVAFCYLSTCVRI